MPVEAKSPTESFWTGTAVAPGIAIAPVHVFNPIEPAIPKRRLSVQEIPQETARLEQAMLLTRSQLTAVRGKMTGTMGMESAAVFDAHLMAVDDPAFVQDILRRICDERMCAEQAVSEAAEQYVRMFQNMEDDYLRERAVDIQDVARRIQRNLAGDKADAIVLPSKPHILAAWDISPSDMVLLPKDKVRGILLAGGSPTSHATILIRAMGIPAVLRMEEVWPSLHNGMPGILDGARGKLILNPTEDTAQKYRKIRATRISIQKRLNELKSLKAITPDGLQIALAANIEMPSDVREVQERGANGIGLFRTEYLYLAADRPPEEETQYQAYAAVAKALSPARTVIRTVDLGGDKLISSMRGHQEGNPFLGWRAIRLCLAQPEMFKQQLRAILRAGVHNPNVAIMYPMVSGLQEVLAANQLLAECKQELTRENTPFHDGMKVGIMVEIPSAAISANTLAAHVDFFSIGTNDLTQYTLAVDRNNDRVAHLYDPLHPAVLQLIKMTVQAGEAHGIPTALCGEIAGNALVAPLLVGLGVNELSTAPVLLPLVKEAIRKTPAEDCRRLAQKALTLSSAAEIADLCRKLLSKTAPHILKIMD